MKPTFKGTSFSITRRRFLQSAGTTSTVIWLPGMAYAQALEDVQEKLTGVSKWDLDTPALCVDLDHMEHNFSRIRTTTDRNGIGFRPHAKTHKTPAIAELQIADGALGICTAKVGEAAAMIEHGIKKVLMTTCNVTTHKISLAMELCKRSDQFIQAVFQETNARDLSAAAQEAGVIADVVVDVDPGGHRTGIAPGKPALELAQLIDRLPGLRQRGLLCYDGRVQHEINASVRRSQSVQAMEPAADTLEKMRLSGLNTEIFSGGGTGTYNIDHEIPGFTDVQCGSYLFMDMQYLANESLSGDDSYTDFKPSLTVLTTVVNTHIDGMATTDAGQKSLTIHKPDPKVLGESGVSYRTWGDEFGRITYDEPTRTYQVGDKLEVIVPHCDPVVNLYDVMFATRNNRVEHVWPISARGDAQ